MCWVWSSPLGAPILQLIGVFARNCCYVSLHNARLAALVLAARHAALEGWLNRGRNTPDDTDGFDEQAPE